jgi:hypothetical protein
MRAWIELPPEWGWGPGQLLKGKLTRKGYHVEEHRGVGRVVLSVRTAPGRTRGTPPGPSPWFREPLLERALPDSLLADTVIDVDAAAEVELRDGSWVRARVGAEWRDRQGRWCVHLNWHASTEIGGRRDVFVYDPEHIRKA